MRYLLYIFIGISGLMACSDSSDLRYPRYADFPQTKALQAEVVRLDTALFRYPFRVTVRDLYLKQLTGMQEKETLPATTLEAEQSEYDLGTVKEGTTKQQIVTVQNTGTTVFRLKGFTTSCDCTGATADWKELHPGDRGTITVSYEAEQPGDFCRTVEIYGNIPNNSLQLSFIGTVK